MEMRAVHEARGKPDGVYFDVNDGRLPQRDTVMRSIPARHGFREASHGFREASKTRSASIYDGERTQKYVTPRKAERNTVLRRLYEAVRSLHVVFYTTSHLILSLVNTQISLAILSALVAISSAE